MNFVLVFIYRGGLEVMGSEGVIGIEGSCDVENTIFVAVGKNVKESKSTLLWALEYFAGRKLCLLHVHHPARFLHFSELFWLILNLYIHIYVSHDPRVNST